MFKLLYDVFDQITKAPILNMHQHHGRYGCPCCLHDIHGGTMLYPAWTEYPLRTQDSINDVAIQAEGECSIVDETKGKGVFSHIIDLLVGTPIDYALCALTSGKEACWKIIFLINKKENWLRSNQPAPTLGRAPQSIYMLYWTYLLRE